MAAAAGGNRRVELVCSGCHAVSENGVWVINKPEMCEVQTRHRGEDDRDESIRMKCSGKSAAAGHGGREEFKRGERLEQRVRRATALSAMVGDQHHRFTRQCGKTLLLLEYLTLREIKTRYSTVLY